MKKTYIRLAALAFTTIPLITNASQNDTPAVQPQNSSSYNAGEKLGSAISDSQDTMHEYYKKTSKSVKSMANETQIALKNKAQQSSMYMSQVSNRIKNEFSKASEAVINSSNEAKETISHKANQASKSINKTTESAQNKVENFKKGFDSDKDKTKPAPF